MQWFNPPRRGLRTLLLCLMVKKSVLVHSPCVWLALVRRVCLCVCVSVVLVRSPCVWFALVRRVCCACVCGAQLALVTTVFVSVCCAETANGRGLSSPSSLFLTLPLSCRACVRVRARGMQVC